MSHKSQEHLTIVLAQKISRSSRLGGKKERKLNPNNVFCAEMQVWASPEPVNMASKSSRSSGIAMAAGASSSPKSELWAQVASKMGTARCLWGVWSGVQCSSPRRCPFYWRTPTIHWGVLLLFFVSFSLNTSQWLCVTVQSDPLDEEPPCPHANGFIFATGKSQAVTHHRPLSLSCKARGRGCAQLSGLRCPALAWHGMRADAALCFWAGFMVLTPNSWVVMATARE